MLLLWLEALLVHWWALMSCALFTAIGAYVLKFNKSNRWTLWVIFGAAVVLLLVASFQAWQDEHKKLVDLQARFESPEFSFKLQSAWWGSNPNKTRLVVVVTGILTNPHGPQSAALDWQMNINTGSKNEQGEVPLLSGEDITIPLKMPGERSITLKPSDWWPSNTEPIVAGGTSKGWFLAVFKNVAEEDLTNGATITLSISDAVGNKRHSGNMPIDKKDREGITIPGDF